MTDVYSKTKKITYLSLVAIAANMQSMAPTTTQVAKITNQAAGGKSDDNK